jgi:hypothetical protein
MNFESKSGIGLEEAIERLPFFCVYFLRVIGDGGMGDG